MTYLEVSYRYQVPLSPKQMRRLGELPGRYGIRRVQLDEKNHLARIAYDASRFTESEVVHWIRLAGIPLRERVDASRISA